MPKIYFIRCLLLLLVYALDYLKSSPRTESALELEDRLCVNGIRSQINNSDAVGCQLINFNCLSCFLFYFLNDFILFFISFVVDLFRKLSSIINNKKKKNKNK